MEARRQTRRNEVSEVNRPLRPVSKPGPVASKGGGLPVNCKNVEDPVIDLWGEAKVLLLSLAKEREGQLQFLGLQVWLEATSCGHVQVLHLTLAVVPP